jgi:hypothetical protein
MAEIIQKTGGDKVKLGSIFDAEAVRAFNQANAEYMKSGQLGSLQKFMDVQGTGAKIMEDSARAANDASAAMTSLYTAWSKFADTRLSGIIEGAANALNALGSEGADTAMSVLGYGAGAMGLAVLGRKAWGGFKWARGMLGGSKTGKGAGGLGGLLGGGSRPIPVYVVNDRMSMMPGEYGGGWQGGGAAKGGKAGRGGWLRRGSKFLRGSGRLSKGLGLAGSALMAVGSVADIADAWTDDSLTSSQKWGRTARSGLSTAGSVGGGVLGATIGSVILPGVGTVVGGWLGSLAGGWLGEKAGGWLAGSDEKEQPEGRLRIEVSDDRTRVTRLDARGMEVDVDSGPIMMGVGR